VYLFCAMTHNCHWSKLRTIPYDTNKPYGTRVYWYGMVQDLDSRFTLERSIGVTAPSRSRQGEVHTASCQRKGWLLCNERVSKVRMANLQLHCNRKYKQITVYLYTNMTYSNCCWIFCSLIHKINCTDYIKS